MPTAQWDALGDIKAAHPPSTDWWFFPGEEKTKVQGFLGTGKIFIVGVRPSNSSWDENHEHRRAFYDLLAAEGAQDCHLTDFYKRRAPAGASPKQIPSEEDFDEHLKVFHEEVELLRPSKILAMGVASDLLKMHIKLSIKITKVMHFGAVYYGKRVEFEARLRSAIREARLE
jgi:hypothetical protein